MPFSIGAGDAHLELGCIGEYATRWNKRACDDENPMHEIKQTLLGTIQPLERTVELLEQRNKKLEQENEEQKQIIKRTSQWRVNKDIKSPFANISGLCCVHCDHKDEYIIELEEENQKLKQMLKKVADDAEGLFMGFAGYNPYEKRLKHEDCEAREYCNYCDRDCDCDGQCKWRYEDDVKKLLNPVEDSRDNFIALLFNALHHLSLRSGQVKEPILNPNFPRKDCIRPFHGNSV